MKKIIFLLASVALIFSSCGDDALKVNETIILEVETVNDGMQTISNFISADEYDRVQEGLDSLAVAVARANKVINGLGNNKAGAYKQSALDYINFVGDKAPAAFNQSTEMFKVAKAREEADIASGKQSPDHLNFGPDFDAARKVMKEFKAELKKRQQVLFEKQEKFAKANGLPQ